MKRKGSAIILVITVFAVFVSISVFVSAINASNVLEDSVDLLSGDVEVLTESELQKENLEEQYGPGLNYSLNNQAFQMARHNRWKDSIPEISDIESSFVEGSQEKLNNRFTDISFSCEVEEAEVKADDIDEGEYTVETDGNKVGCERSGTAVDNYFTDDIDVENPDNRFSALAGYAIRIVENFDEQISGETVEGEGSESGSCGEARGNVKSVAIDNAREDAMEDLSYGSDAVDETEEVEDTSVDHSTDYTGSGTAEITDSSECCLERETVTDEDGEVVTDEDGEPKKECVRKGTEHDAEASWAASEVTFDISVTDEENELEHSGGFDNLVYNAEYVYSFE